MVSGVEGSGVSSIKSANAFAAPEPSSLLDFGDFSAAPTPPNAQNSFTSNNNQNANAWAAFAPAPVQSIPNVNEWGSFAAPPPISSGIFCLISSE